MLSQKGQVVESKLDWNVSLYDDLVQRRTGRSLRCGGIMPGCTPQRRALQARASNHQNGGHKYGS